MYRQRYRPHPRPGKGNGAHPPTNRGSVGWTTKQRNDATDTGAGYVFVLSGMGGAACDQIQFGTTRNHPAVRAVWLQNANLTKHWADERTIRAKHRANPPQLWACFVPDRKATKARISQALVGGYSDSEGRDVPLPDLATVLNAMGEVTGSATVRFWPDIRISESRPWDIPGNNQSLRE